MQDDDSRRPVRRWVTGGALVASGLLAGGVLAGTLTAGAADTTPAATTPGVDSSTSTAGGERDESKSQRPDEQLLTGSNAAKAKAAALAKYPGATIDRVESDSDGVYEAHLTTADGQRVTVEFDKNFDVTGEESGGPGHGTGGEHFDRDDQSGA